jgi:DNA-binding NarL/FixJ family response regulator
VGARTPDSVSGSSESVGSTSAEDRRTSRQIDVLRLLAKGLSNKEIAAELSGRTKTVMHHTTAIYRELGVCGRSEATAVAFRSGLVD